MKNKSLLAALVLSCLRVSFSAWGLDIEISGGGGNIAFDSGLKAPLGDKNDPKAFAPALFPLAKLAVSGEHEAISFEGGFETSPVLRNRLFAGAGINLAYLNIRAGPIIGLFNTAEEWFSPGLFTAMTARYPGIAFVNISASSSLGSSLETIGSYTQKSGSLSAGFWLPYVICSFTVSSERFSRKTEANLLAEDSLMRYFFRADVFTKNVPYTIKVDLGYGELTRSYYSSAVSGTDIVSTVQTDAFRFFYLGLEAAYTFNASFKLFFTGEMPVYAWSASPMKNPASETSLFTARAGVIFSFF